MEHAINHYLGFKTYLKWLFHNDDFYMIKFNLSAKLQKFFCIWE